MLQLRTRLRRRRLWRWAALGLALLALLVALRLQARSPAPPRPHAAPPPPQVGASLFPAAAPPLQVGLHLKNLYNLQLESQTFSADGWFWLEWGEAVEAVRRANGLTPLQMVEFANQVETWDAQIEPETAEPVRLPNGNSYQLFRFSARFYIDSIDQRLSPFETLVLPVVIETRPETFALGRASVVLRPARGMRNFTGDYSDLAGYTMRRTWIVPGHNVYDLFGPHQDEVYSQLSFRVAYGSEPWAAFMKWILPLLIVMTIVLLAPSLEGSLGEMRLAIPSTALLTLVFLQQTYKSELPATPYLTFLDELYAYCYLVAVGLFALFLWSSNQMEQTSPEQLEATRRRINRIDSLSQWSAFLGLGLVALLAWFF